MPARLTFFAIAAFWVTMNVLLWRAEFGTHNGETPVPIELIWRKIMTAPDTSSLSVFQNRNRMGYCEFDTSIGQEMASVDTDKAPPDGLVTRAGYQIHSAGNISINDLTNRIKFDGRVLFSSAQEWREVTLRISSRTTAVEIHSVATNQLVHLKIISEGAVLEKNLTFAEMQNPNTLLRALVGNFADSLFSMMDLPDVADSSTTQKLAWRASRTRVKIGTEAVPVYRIETDFLGHPILMDVSTLGEILRVELPGNISARIDEWTKP